MSIPMTEMDPVPEGRREVLDGLHRNGQHRRKAEWELDQARQELAELLARGAGLTRPLKIAEMSRQAGISRETAYKLLRRRGGGVG